MFFLLSLFLNTCLGQFEPVRQSTLDRLVYKQQKFIFTVLEAASLEIVMPAQPGSGGRPVLLQAISFSLYSHTAEKS